jgi:ketosteroid isomerase-like protein
MNAVAMESANRAYVQQTLNRLKDIANGAAPELISENAVSELITDEQPVVKKPAARKKAAGTKKPASKATPKAKKEVEEATEVVTPVVSPDEEKTA